MNNTVVKDGNYGNPFTPELIDRVCCPSMSILSYLLQAVLNFVCCCVGLSGLFLYRKIFETLRAVEQQVQYVLLLCLLCD